MSEQTARRVFLKALTAGTALVATRPAAAAEPVPEVTWRLVSSFSKSLDLLHGGAETFARTVGELTGGRFKIDVSPPTEAVPGLGVLDAVKAGTVEAGQTYLDYFVGSNPALALATAIPFGMNAREQFAFESQGGGSTMLDEVLADANARAFPAGNTGAQMGGFFKRELKTSTDLNGLKIRIGGIAGRVMQKLGAVPQATPRADFASALESGALDAVSWVSPRDDEKLGGDDPTRIPKLAPNYYYPGWWRGGAMIHVVVNRTKFDALPAAFQAAIRAGATVAYMDMLSRYDAANPGALRRLVVAGAQLRPFPQEILEAAYKASADVLREIGDEDPRFRKQTEALLAFRNEQYLWWQVGEYTFDNFLIRQRARG